MKGFAILAVKAATSTAGKGGRQDEANRIDAVPVLRRRSRNDRNTAHTEGNGLHPKMQKNLLLREINQEMGL